VPAKKPHHPDDIPRLVYANAQGEILDFPDLLMAGRSGTLIKEPEPEDLIPLPPSSELFLLPQRHPVGFDPHTGEQVVLSDGSEGEKNNLQAVAAFMAPAHTTILSTAFEKAHDSVEPLPLFAYTAVGWYKERFWVAGFKSDNDTRQDFSGVKPETIDSRTQKRLKKFPKNRLIQHLGICSLTYGCPAAKNYFLDRFEAPLPTSPACNASCVGCISLQPSGCCPSTQERIRFSPKAEEIAEIAIPHLNKAKHPIVSFGQGCEGEPLLQADTIEKAIKKIRKTTTSGTINLNTNASLPEAVAKLAEAGLDSMRVSLNSARMDCHTRYYRPHNFDLDDVKASIDAMKKREKYVSLNYFILPGFTDTHSEFDALCSLIENHRPDFMQLRNLNMDPDWYFETVQQNTSTEPMGIRHWLKRLKTLFPFLQFGYFNPPIHEK